MLSTDLLNDLEKMYIEDPTTQPTAFWKLNEWFQHEEMRRIEYNDTISLVLGNSLVCRVPVDHGYISEIDHSLSTLVFLESQELNVSWQETKYFKLYHDHLTIGSSELKPDYYFEVVKENEFTDIVNLINNSYEKIRVNEEKMREYSRIDVYNRNLWIWVIEKNTGIKAALGIAEFDKKIGEGALDWIQVDSRYRGNGLGKATVNELLKRISEIGLFTTVSGEVDNITNPEQLYRACGFKGEKIWHVYHKK